MRLGGSASEVATDKQVEEMANRFARAMTSFLESRAAAETLIDPASQATAPAKSQPKDPNSTERETTPEVEKSVSGVLMLEDRARAADEAKPNDPKQETNDPPKTAQPNDPQKEKPENDPAKTA